MPKNSRIWLEIEERDLYAIAAGALEPDQLVNDVFGAADNLDVAAEGAVFIAMRLPGDRVAAALMRNEAFDRPLVGHIEDCSWYCCASRSVSRHTIIGFMIVRNSRLRSAAAVYDGIMRGESGKRRIDLVSGRAGDKDKVGMRCGVVDAGWGARRID